MNAKPTPPEGRLDLALCGLPAPVEQCSFEQLVEALESVAARLSAADLGIEAAVDLYEQAEILHALANDRLAAVQARVEKLRPAD